MDISLSTSPSIRSSCISIITLWKAASSWMSMKLFSQIHFNLHRVFTSCYSTNHLTALFHPHSPKSGVESLSWLQAALHLLPLDLCLVSSWCVVLTVITTEGVLESLVSLVYSHSHSPIDGEHRKGRAEEIFIYIWTGYPFIWIFVNDQCMVHTTLLFTCAFLNASPSISSALLSSHQMNSLCFPRLSPAWFSN